ncbi:hypothetical protein C1752_09171 [Acaryochloris thomasi RCC1774]|uniref:Uncharacterized protein n=1 Tax=Acaryochloris thomasi RCC1774 TaxID=1764569 RepID=A0A2W1JKS3_9CYAN|nr:hypothetical protein [Acaryochloris thomasi]PZD70794.1 hypothetical protein C1752_09171 [Acaryochloris thomasi RCC1774]
MQEQEQYAVPAPRNVEGIQKSYKSDAQRMRAKNAQARLAAKQRAERDQRQRDAIAQIPEEHRI